MTLVAVSIAVEGADAVEPALGRAAQSVAAGARLVEWRIDALTGGRGGSGPGVAAAAAKLIERAPAPCIVTCRHRREGGEYDGDEVFRAKLLAGLVTGGRPPRYVDVEHSAWAASPELRERLGAAIRAGKQRDVHTSLILSMHDFDRRPPDLLQRLEAMSAEPACDVVKLAWHARSLRDNLEAFDLMSERRGPMIALCMGPFGLPSRVLAGKFGGLLTYASDEPGAETAPGQPTVQELLETYRFNQIGPSTAVYGVVGWPVWQSRGPRVHNAGFEAVGHDGVYLALPVPKEQQHFDATMTALLEHSRLDFRGCSVTGPHKENALRLAQDRNGAIEPEALRIGAVNTLAVGPDGALSASNTDAPAFLASLCAGMGIEPAGLAGLKIAVLGAGGAARAVVAGLVDARAEVVLFNRTTGRAENLAADFPGAAVATDAELSTLRFDAYVNCTPIGMAGGDAPRLSPLPPDAPLDENCTVLDTIYVPPLTPLLVQAKQHGARPISGLDMFTRQAALQFRLWTGKAAPADIYTAPTIDSIPPCLP